jgi:hypothetical protein
MYIGGAFIHSVHPVYQDTNQTNSLISIIQISTIYTIIFYLQSRQEIDKMIPLRDDISLVESFIYTVQKTIQQNGDPDETEHLQSEAHVEDFIAAMKWVKYLHGRALLLSDQARNLGWKQFLDNIDGVMIHVVRWAYEKYPEGLIYAKIYRQRGGSVWDPSGGTDVEMLGNYEDDDSNALQQDWTWALKAANELELVTKVLFKHCEQVTGMMRVDFMATALEEMSL